MLLSPVSIIRNIVSDELIKIKSDFISCLIKNQTNTTLLSHINPTYNTPLKVYAEIIGPDEYIRRVTQLKIYEQLNFDALIKGPKQKEVLQPNQYTQELDEKYNAEYKGTLIGNACLIEPSVKIRRSCIENECKIGGGTDILNSIVMANSVIEDGYISGDVGAKSWIR